MRYAGFISYSRQDTSFARWLFNILETTRRPGAARGVKRTLFLDTAEIVPGPSLPARLDEALHDSDWLVVILSPAAARSEWVNKEIESFAAARGGDRILGIVTSGEPTLRPLAGESAIPPALAQVLPDNPLFADARQRGGRRRAALQILSAMENLPVDAFLRRDTQRRRLAAAGITAAAIAGSLLVAGVGVRSSRMAEADQLFIQSRTFNGIERVRLLTAAVRIAESTPFGSQSAALRELDRPENKLYLGVLRVNRNREVTHARADYARYASPDNDRSGIYSELAERLSAPSGVVAMGLLPRPLRIEQDAARRSLTFYDRDSGERLGGYTAPSEYDGRPVKEIILENIAVSPNARYAVLKLGLTHMTRGESLARVAASERALDAFNRNPTPENQAGAADLFRGFTEGSVLYVLVDLRTGAALHEFSALYDNFRFASDDTVVSIIARDNQPYLRITPIARPSEPVLVHLHGAPLFQLSLDGRVLSSGDLDLTLDALSWNVREAIAFFCTEDWPGAQMAPDAEHRRDLRGGPSAARPCG